MARRGSLPTSFSAGRRWSIFFTVVLSIVAAVSLAAMLNYLGARHFLRFSWSTRVSPGLSPRTLGALKSITNDVKVIVYYEDTKNDLSQVVSALLNEYRIANPKISVQVVDAKHDAGLARQVQTTYKLAPSDLNLVIFDCNSNVDKIPDKELWDYDPYTQVPKDGHVEWEHKLKSFRGEPIFSALLLDVVDTNYQTACFVEGEGEPDLDDTRDMGYSEFKDILIENHLRPMAIHLTGSNEVPADCNLLVVAGPQRALPADELEKISHYLAQGKNLFVLFDSFDNSSSGNLATGLEKLLLQWGVKADPCVVTDPDNMDAGNKMVVSAFNPKHPITEHLEGYQLTMVFPRSVRKLNTDERGLETSALDELLFTGNHASISTGPAIQTGARLPLAVAVKKANVKNGLAVASETRIVVVGDSWFLKNELISDAANADFARFATAWLTKQTRYLEGVAAHRMVAYNLLITNSQRTAICWIFLGAMPGGILLLGGLVWLRRRH